MELCYSDRALFIYLSRSWMLLELGTRTERNDNDLARRPCSIDMNNPHRYLDLADILIFYLIFALMVIMTAGNMLEGR